MALPTRADLMTLDYARLGAPFVVGNAGVPIRYYFDMQTNHLLGS